MISHDLEDRVNCFTNSHFQRDWKRGATNYVNAEGAEEMLRFLSCAGVYGSEAMHREIADEQKKLAESIRARYKVADEVRAEIQKMVSNRVTP